MPTKIAFVMDPIESIHPNKDTTFAFMLEAQYRGWEVYFLQPKNIWLTKDAVFASMQKITVNDSDKNYYSLESPVRQALTEMDLIFLRKDPPFDMEYVYLTYLLELAVQQGAQVINDPRSVRDSNEKLFATHFPQCCSDFLVSSQKEPLQEFATHYQSIILKPLDGMGGRSIFHFSAEDPNLKVALETLTNNEKQRIMAQEFIPEIKQGDKRVLMIDGEPLEYALARIPASNDFRGNLAAGASYEGRELTDRDRWIAHEVGPTLKEKGLVFVGLDIIGDYLTEINVTSPTCARELNRLFDLNIAKNLLDVCEEKI